MSALVVAVGPEGVVAASDGVYYTYETGVVSGFVSKVIMLPEFNCFIGATGAGAFAVGLRWEINQQIGSFDELVSQFAELCERVHRHMFSNWGIWDRGRDTEVSCVIAGWSDARQAYEAWRVVSYDKPSVSNGLTTRLEPFKAMMLPADGIWCSYSPSTMGEFGLMPPLKQEATTDIMSRMVCACRAESGHTVGDGDDPTDTRWYMAGGFIQLTLVQKDFSQSWIEHRWPEDEIGKRIDPTGPDRFPAHLRERHEAQKRCQI